MISLILLAFIFQHLANYASENLEAMNPPLFLRFLNLLMNDAIFLLDEAIQVRPYNNSGFLSTYVKNMFYVFIHFLSSCEFS